MQKRGETMAEKKNSDIREAAKRNNIKLWQIADKLGMTDGNFSRKLRHELSQEEKRTIMNLIEGDNNG